MKLILMVLALLAAQTASAALIGTRIQAIADAGGPDEAPAATDFDQQITTGQASAIAISPHAQASANGFVSFGVIKVSAQAASQSGAYVGASNAIGEWGDVVTLNSAAFNGQQARITASVTLLGSISPTGAGEGGVSLEFHMGLANTTLTGAWSLDTPLNATGFPNSGLSIQPGGTLTYSNTHSVTLTVTLGNSFLLSERLSVGAGSKPACMGFPTNINCFSSESGAVATDFGHSSYWNGVSSIAVKNANGVFVPQDLSLFTLAANSGTNYFQSFVPQPVPVPGAFWLLAPALALFSRKRRVC